MEVVEEPESYKLESTFTNKSLRVKHGMETSVYRMEFVSSQEFTWIEFAVWRDCCKLVHVELPKLKAIQQKAQALKQADDYALTDTDIEYVCTKQPI